MRTPLVLLQLWAVLMVALLVAACGGKTDRAPATTSEPPPSQTVETPAPPEPPRPDIVEAPPLREDPGNDLRMMEDARLDFRDLSLDVLNEREPLADIRFDFDRAALSEAARTTLNGHADLLQQYDEWTLLIEGHCDERGTVEYNLALGERRANAVYNYLMNLGISGGRLKTISYGKEFPKDLSHTEQAWAANRRGHFEITGN